MKKVLIVVPHLSTGGLPQYTLKQINLFSHQYEFYCVEWENITGGVLVVQRNQIEKNLGDRFYSINSKKEKLVEIIDQIQPDYIHFQEIPESFIPLDLLDIIYFKERWYRIVVTTHSSNTDPNKISYTADKFILVSDWSRKRFSSVFGENICDIWEYPIENISFDKNKAKENLGFDSSLKHILNVGLFTPAKNQLELIEIARKMINEPIQFHFVGNQAMNFQGYWEPLMKDFPSNCVYHGERSDVDKFYKAADLFYFPSNLELNPLVVKESLSYGLPTFIKKLDPYGDEYDGLVNYISDDQSKNINMIKKILNIKKLKPKIQAIHLLTDVTHDREKRSIEFISKLSEYGIDYKQQINEIYDKKPPTDFCNRPEHVSDEPESIGNGYGRLTGRHYGCFLAHINAIKNIDEEYDYTLIFEADANIETSYEDFVEMVYNCCKISEIDDVYFFGLSDNNSSNKIEVNELFSIAKTQDLSHAYLIPNRCKSWYIDRINDTKWDGYDIWLNIVFLSNEKLRYTTRKVYSSQLSGMSLIDGYVKWEESSDTHYDYVEIGTSDFETASEVFSDNHRGLSIEPIIEYLDRLPIKPKNKKLNYAISDTDGVSNIYYVGIDDIEKNNLPEWIRGCNSIDKIHPSVQRYFEENNVSVNVLSKQIERVSVRSLFQRESIQSIDFLKIDTEGHDFIIIRDLLKTSVRPKKIKFEANSLYTESEIIDIICLMEKNGYHLTQKTSNDIIMSFIDERYNGTKKPILIISTGRRLEYLTKTIRELFNNNPNFDKQIQKVWVLDDRSSHSDRLHIEKLMTSYFGDNYNTISFNSIEPFYFVEKFRMIKNLIKKDDVVFLMEDDWECHDNLRLEFHVNNLLKSDWTQIAFADPIEIQDQDIQINYRIDLDYWKNPYPSTFKHPYKWDGDICYWNRGSINNWTNNPSLIKGEVFFRTDFTLCKNFEAEFANSINGNQVFTNECLFRHFGQNSLINKL